MIAATDKAFQTLQARAAMEGLTCTLTEAGNIVLARGATGWIFGSAPAAEKWLDRLQQPSTEVPA